MGVCGSKSDSTSNTKSKETKSPDPVPAPTENHPKPTEEKNEESVEPGATRVEQRYDVGDEIGRGAFSIVRKAKSKKTGKDYAVKFIEKKYVDKQDLVLLGREIDIMKKIDHANVLRLQEVFETDETIALVMEFVDGGELFYKIVEKGNYSERDAARIVRQMIRGVMYLHGQGIAHRDLKPENLLCASDDGKEEHKPFRVVIADFGLSKAFDSGEPLETSCGTPDYVAPEVITAEGQYNKAVDMWSCGVITYVLLCGFSPFLSSNQTGLFEKIMKAEYDFPDPEWTNISENAKDFIRHLLVKDPKTRYTAEQCTGHSWLNGEHGTHALGGGQISDKMNAYNQQRKATKKTL